MGEQFRPVTTNLASVRVEGLAGIPLLALVIVIAIVLPEARWLLVSGVAAGALAGAIMIFVRRRRHTDPGGDSPTLLGPHTLGNRSAEKLGELVRHEGSHGEHEYDRRSIAARLDHPGDSRRGSGHRRLVAVGDLICFSFVRSVRL